MLVLSRKYQEKIRIGDHVTVTILRTKGKSVRVGIEAPSDVLVLRGEKVAGAAKTPLASPGAPKDTPETGGVPPIPPQLSA